MIGVLVGVIVVGVVALALVVTEVRHDQAELHRDEQSQKATVSHTKLVQQAGGPVAVCLREALERVAPQLEQDPTVQKPLEAYVRLQSHRYPGVTCPDR